MGGGNRIHFVYLQTKLGGYQMVQTGCCGDGVESV